MAKIIVHDVKGGVVERDETPAEELARNEANLIEAGLETALRERNREGNNNNRMQRAMARVMLGYKRNNDAGSWNKFLTDVMAKFDELGSDE